jgi:hypothetical protein
MIKAATLNLRGLAEVSRKKQPTTPGNGAAKPKIHMKPSGAKTR